MALIVWGVNHETASFVMREQVAICNADLASTLPQLTNNGVLQELVLVSTCNRSEWYIVADESARVIELLAEHYNLSLEALQQSAYCYKEAAAIDHLLRVCCGLNSMILGEPQIFGQVKDAYQMACQVGCVGPYLQFLFNHVFSATKRIRQYSKIGENPVSMASAALNLAKCIFSDVFDLHVVLVGVSEMTLSALKYFHNSGAASITIANRTFSKAQEYAIQYQAQAVELKNIIPSIARANIVISATGSSSPVISDAMLKQALKLPRQRPLLLLDLGMPRDIEVPSEPFDFVYLYNIDDLKQITQEGMAKRKTAAKHAEKLIKDEVQHFIKLFSERRFAGMIKAYRGQAENLRIQEVNKAIRALNSGQDPAVVLHSMARALTNKLMHQPSIQLRQASYHGHVEVLEVAKRILGIGEHNILNDDPTLLDQTD